MNTPTAGQLVIRAAPDYLPANAILRPLAKSARCALCSQHVQEGQPSARISDLPGSFTDQPYLCADAGCICEVCYRLTARPFCQALSTAAVTEDGLFGFAKNVDIAYWMRNPPSGHFAFGYRTAKMQHIWWKAQVSVSRDAFFICIGGNNHLIRRSLLLKAADRSYARYVNGAKRKAEARGKAEKDAVGNPSYLIRTNFDADFSAFLPTDLTAEERSIALSLNPGELWALARIQSVDPSTISHPASLIQ